MPVVVSGAVGSTFSGELFCRMAGVCRHGAGMRRDTLPDSQFPAGQRTLSPAAQKAFPGRLLRIVVWSWVVWAVGFFMLTFGILYLKEPYQLAFWLGGIFCAALYKHLRWFHKGDSWIR
ncbi:hypothetical protein [Escherichia coli]|uniref:hypothetical protein n=1 Tax=Escherichia coli TaxID=562 RepID=UPI001F335A45|nr:hypothetical protein [Escherichia coli]